MDDVLLTDHQGRKIRLTAERQIHMAEMKVWYDREGEYLEVIFENAAAVTEEVSDDIFERRTPDGRIVGFTVYNFSQHDRDNLTLPLTVTATPA